MKKFISQTGFGLLETIIAVALFLIIAVTGVSTVIHTFSVNRLGNEQTEATLYAQQGIEAVKAIHKRGWANLSLGTFGLDDSGGTWIFSGTNNVNGKYTRTVVISEAYRDIDGNLVESGGTVDPNTYKVTVTTGWAFAGIRTNNVELVTYLTNWGKYVTGITACSDYCISIGYNNGTCRAGPQACNANGDTYESGGNNFCTIGQLDSCCCTSVGPTPIPTATPTPPFASCDNYCTTNGYLSGTCRGTPQLCTANGEINEIGGNTYCTGGASADTCCCTPLP